MLELRPAGEAENQAWLDGWTARLRACYGLHGAPDAWVASQVQRRTAVRAGARWATFTLAADGAAVGMLAVSVLEQWGGIGFLADVRIEPEFRRRGHGAAAVRAAEDWARGQGATALQAVTNPADPAHAALLARYPVQAHEMIRKLPAAGPPAAGMQTRPLTPAEFDGWRAASVRRFTAAVTDSGMLPPGEAARWSAEQFDLLLPEGPETPGHSLLALCADGVLVATNWIGHHYAPGMSWVYEVEVAEGYRGRGFGRAAMVMGEQAALKAGDTHLGLNVFGRNAVAQGLYRSMGYRGYNDARSAGL